MLFMK